MSNINILLADDHPLFREGIAQFLQKERAFQVVGQASDGEEAVRLAAEKSPDVIVMDIEMPKVDGLDATRQIKAAHPGISVLVLTVHDDEEYIAALLEAGAAGYLLKTTYGEELAQAIRAVHSGKFVLDTQIGPRVFRAFALRPHKAALNGSDQLGAKEMQLMKLVARGMTNEEMTRQLGISFGAVKDHLSAIFSKLGVGSRTEAVTACLRRGILSLDDLSVAGA